MKGLITDREQSNVLRRDELAAKGFAGMTAAEQTEWLGNPLVATEVNLLPPGPYFSSTVKLNYTSDAIIATAVSSGTYLYAVSIVGEAADFVNKTLTLSADYIGSVGGGTPLIAAYWHSDSGYERIDGGSLSTAGSVTFNTGSNPNKHTYLALYVYASTSASVESGAAVRYSGVMLENGSTRHPYVPFNEVLPTRATKGAYNYSDLNRVERSVAEVAELLGLKLVTKTDWKMWDLPTSADMERYLHNIKTIHDVLSGNVPDAPASMSNLTYNKANDIEKILLAGYDRAQSFSRCGEINCGEV